METPRSPATQNAVLPNRGNMAVTNPGRLSPRDLFVEPNPSSDQPRSHNATASPPTAVTLERNAPPTKSFARYVEEFRATVIRGDQAVYELLQSAVIWAFDLANDPALRRSEDFPDGNGVALLELVLKRAEPDDRNGRKRANKEYLALQVLLQDDVARDKIAEQIARRGGIAKLAREYAHRRRHNGSPTDTSLPSRARVILPAGANTDEPVLLLRQPLADGGKKGKCKTEIIGSVPATVTVEDLRKLLHTIKAGHAVQ